MQGLPALFKGMSQAIQMFPSGTVFSMSFGITEQTFGGAAKAQTAKFDQVFQQGIAKGDTFFAASGDNGTLGTVRQHKDTTTYSNPTVGWPASSPYVTAVGGTQLQDGWTWDPTSDVPFLADGSFNPAYFAATTGGDRNYVWNESWLPAASGGGPSAIYSRPSWQSNAMPGAGNHRLVPDVAWNAAVNGGVLIYISAYPNFNGPAGFYIYGGTSAATPQVAALTALANERRASEGKPPIGNANPAIYASNGAWFTDVTPATEGAAASGHLTNNNDWDFNGNGNAVTPDPVPGWPANHNRLRRDNGLGELPGLPTTTLGPGSQRARADTHRRGRLQAGGGPCGFFLTHRDRIASMRFLSSNRGGFGWLVVRCCVRFRDWPRSIEPPPDSGSSLLRCTSCALRLSTRVASS